ncbi:MAG: hypothetical protein JXK05_08320 [Campylobacterales bacterium]|nr:hypothetical protein [Campylobacterales bacterium]
MVSISTAFAPPLRLIAPFFIAGALFYLMSIVALAAVALPLHWLDLRWVGVVHLYLVGFVMMSIVGALAQLIPVLIEREHCCVALYGAAFVLMVLGILGLFGGFWYEAALLPYSGLLLIVAFGLIAFDLLISAKKSLLKHFSAGAIGWMSLLLLVGSIIGFVMALGLGAGADVAVMELIDTHIVVLFGALLALAYGVAQVLLPMFALAHGFDAHPNRTALRTLIVGVGLYALGAAAVGLGPILCSVGLHLYQAGLMYAKRIRKERDIWFASLLFAYAALALSLLGALWGLLLADAQLLLAASVLFGLGFLGFLISGHLYKIIPFLVWFERFSPLVGKQKVPMLHEMVPHRAAWFGFGYASIGTVLLVLGVALGSEALIFGGVSALFVGGLFLLSNLVWMLRFNKGAEDAG